MSPETRAAIKEEWQDRHTPDSRARAEASASSTGWLLDWRLFFFTLAALTVASYPIVLALPPGVQRSLIIEGTHKAIPLWALFFAIPLLAVPRLLVARGWKQEMEWLKALPFEVDNYESAMGESPTTRSSFKMHLEFEGDAPTAEALQELLDFEGGTWEFKVIYGDVKVTRSPALPEKDDERNRRLMLWFHRLAEQKLLPLHAEHPIRRFTFVRY